MKVSEKLESFGNDFFIRKFQILSSNSEFLGGAKEVN